MLVLRKGREEHGNGRGILKKVYDKMKSMNLVSTSYQAAIHEVKRVDDALALNPQLTAQEIITAEDNHGINSVSSTHRNHFIDPYVCHQ